MNLFDVTEEDKQLFDLLINKYDLNLEVFFEEHYIPISDQPFYTKLYKELLQRKNARKLIKFFEQYYLQVKALMTSPYRNALKTFKKNNESEFNPNILYSYALKLESGMPEFVEQDLEKAKEIVSYIFINISRGTQFGDGPKWSIYNTPYLTSMPVMYFEDFLSKAPDKPNIEYYEALLYIGKELAVSENTQYMSVGIDMEIKALTYHFSTFHKQYWINRALVANDLGLFFVGSSNEKELHYFDEVAKCFNKKYIPAHSIHYLNKYEKDNNVSDLIKAGEIFMDIAIENSDEYSYITAFDTYIEDAVKICKQLQNLKEKTLETELLKDTMIQRIYAYNKQMNS